MAVNWRASRWLFYVPQWLAIAPISSSIGDDLNTNGHEWSKVSFLISFVQLGLCVWASLRIMRANDRAFSGPQVSLHLYYIWKIESWVFLSAICCKDLSMLRFSMALVGCLGWSSIEWFFTSVRSSLNSTNNNASNSWSKKTLQLSTIFMQDVFKSFPHALLLNWIIVLQFKHSNDWRYFLKRSVAKFKLRILRTHK